MSQVIVESEISQALQDYKQLAERLVRKGSVFSLFKLQTELIRKHSSGDDEELVQEMIFDFMEILKQVVDENVTCPKCNKPYTFRICTGLSREHDNGIELTCEVCGDCYSHSEQRELVTYFNINAWKEADHLRRRSRGFTVTYTLESLAAKAVLFIYDDMLKRPELRINGHRVFDPAEVKTYWEHSKRIIKQWKNGEEIIEESSRVGDGVFYRLDEVI
ncbi:hypothetical protein [Paenibacillus rhizophilus]|uniref:Uncharacterized protein n=1 Tax=Paenibacillus rhizophilus TaxID=1850366 RepID=A0A3N9P690_9BACL|nr:hypothetical protein [Paenibacillus rhizophilus]RQW10837.1 hypothetical protein EH198_13850 [Paenibacillus rhizophilus]